MPHSAETYLRPRGRLRTLLLRCMSGESGQIKREPRRCEFGAYIRTTPLCGFGKPLTAVSLLSVTISDSFLHAFFVRVASRVLGL